MNSTIEAQENTAKFHLIIHCAEYVFKTLPFPIQLMSNDSICNTSMILLNTVYSSFN